MLPVSRYQSFEPGAGSSDSFGKLKALRLPDLTGKKFLDLGCNHGFFCFAALEMGADSVVGVDISEKNISAANARARAAGVADRATFLNVDWENFNQTGFDVVILLSALHYAADQQKLINKIRRMLKPDGLFILEAGVIDNKKADWTSILRGKPPRSDIVSYPTDAKMLNMLSAEFAPRKIGLSTLQPGDLIPRFVWHCPVRKRTLLTIGAPPRSGKTTLVHSLRGDNIPVLDIDVLAISQRGQPTELGRLVDQTYQKGFINRVLDAIDKNGLQANLVDVLLAAVDQISEGKHTVLIMGMSLTFPSFSDALKSKCQNRGDLIVWEARRTV